MAGFWSVFCGESDCSNSKTCSYDVKFLIDPSACMNHLLISCFDALLLIMLLFAIIQKKSSLKPFQRYSILSILRLVSAIFNGALCLVHLILGIWILEDKLKKRNTALPLDLWLLEFIQGLTWLFVGLTFSLQLMQLPRAWLRLFSILMFLVSGIFCALTLFSAMSSRELSIKVALDVLSFSGATLLLLCTYKETKYRDTDNNREIDENESLYTPLNGESNKSDSTSHVTLFAKAGFFSSMTFWWLNPLMKRGKVETLQDKDVPKMREET